MEYCDEYPQHQVSVNRYRVGRYPVTNREYKAFLDATGHDAQ